MTLFEKLTSWKNQQLAYQNAARGKRGHPDVAGFELYLADYLLNLEKELRTKYIFDIPMPQRWLFFQQSCQKALG